jgi:CheY-like chemotaxis protein
MTVEVRCPDCSTTWRVEAPASGEMVCPSCMSRIPIRECTADPAGSESDPDADARPGVPAEDGPVPASGTGATDPAGDLPTDLRATERDMPPAPVTPGPAAAGGRDTPRAARPAPAGRTTDPAPARVEPEVVCPRCQLHFRPGGSGSGPSVQRKTVLVVDDLEYFRRIAEDALRPAFDVKTAASTTEARAALGQGGIDLMVLDLTLDGRSAGRELLAELRPKPCPILIFTAQDESEMYGESWEDLRRLGADDIVIKGMKVADSLRRKVSALLGTPMDDEEPL